MAETTLGITIPDAESRDRAPQLRQMANDIDALIDTAQTLAEAVDEGGGVIKPLAPNLAPGYLRGYEASNIVGLSNGDVIASWPDASPANDPAVQATGANKPTYVTGALDGLPSVRFDGSNDFLAFTTVTTTRTAYFIVKHRTGTQSFPPLLGHATLNDFHGGDSNLLFDSSSANAALRNGTSFINGVDENPTNIIKPTTFRLISMVSTGNLTAQYITNDRNSGRIWDGEMVAIYLYSAAHDDETRKGIEEYFKLRYPTLARIANVLGPLLVYDGNSLVNSSYQVRIGNCLAGNCAAGTPLVSGYVERNFGVAGQNTPQMIADAATQIIPLYNPARAKNIVVVWEGTNDLYFGASSTTAYNNLVTYCSMLRAVGFQVVILTLLPRSNSGTPAGFNTDRLAVNTSIRANYLTFAHALADVAANTTIGDAGDETNTTYYSDLVHLTDAGNDIVAPIVATAISGLPADASQVTPNALYDLLTGPLSEIIMKLRAFQRQVDTIDAAQTLAITPKVDFLTAQIFS